MFFIAAKVIVYMLLPPAIILIFLVLGLSLGKDNRFIGRLFIASGVLLLYFLSIDPVSDALINPLEGNYPAWKGTPVKADAIVVLGGGARDESWRGLGTVPSDVSLERVVTAVRVYRALHIPLVITGGNGDPSRRGIVEAKAMGRVAAGLGVPEKDMTILAGPRTTIESAAAAKSKVKGKRIVLVTSAFHMKRAVAMFKAQGFDPYPAPAGYMGEQRKLAFYSFIPRIDNFNTSAIALSEYLSLAWYGIMGRI